MEGVLSETGIAERAIRATVEDVQTIYGKESIISYVPGDSPSFQAYENSRRKGTAGIENSRRNGKGTSSGEGGKKSNGNQQGTSEGDISFL